MVPPKHKHKWTKGEESALLAGVKKYGIGEWKAIQDDDQFGPHLTSRSNVDLKDKWRNLLTKSKTGISNEGDPLTLVGWSGPAEEEFAVTPMASLTLKRGSHKRRTPARRQIRGGSGSMEGKGLLTPLAPLSLGEGTHQGETTAKKIREGPCPRLAGAEFLHDGGSPDGKTTAKDMLNLNIRNSTTAAADLAPKTRKPSFEAVWEYTMNVITGAESAMKACKKASEEAEFAMAEAVEADTTASIKASQEANVAEAEAEASEVEAAVLK